MSKVIALAIDTEFTSFDKIAGDLIVIGLVEILEDYTLGREQVFYSRPRSPKYYTEGAQKVHGISYFKAVKFPEPRKACIDILKWLAPLKEQFPLTVVNHANGALDFKWLEQLMRNNDLDTSFWRAFNEELVINTIKMAKENLVGLKNNKLNTIAEHYMIELNHHEALSDARACAEIYCNIKQEIGTYSGKLL